MPHAIRSLARTTIGVLVGLSLPALAVAAANDTPEKKPETARVERQAFQDSITAQGKVIPLDAWEFVFRPEAYKGELRILEAAPAGLTVAKGDVLLRFDTESIDLQIEDAEFELESARLKAEHTEAEHEMADQAAGAELARTEMNLRHARDELETLMKFDIPIRNQDFAHSKQGFANRISDQEEEIRQLGAMYQEDELTEETEEIVLNRSRRDLERSKTSFQAMLEKRDVFLKRREPNQIEKAELGVQQQTDSLERLMRGQEMKRESRSLLMAKTRRDLGKKKEALEKLKRDRSEFVVAAPHAGVVIHGDIESPKAFAVKAGGKAGAHTPILGVARPGRCRIDFQVPESKLQRVATGSTVSIRPKALEGQALPGKLDKIYRIPSTAKGDEGQYAARAALGKSDERLLPGMSCEVELALTPIKDALVVPSKALETKAGKKICKVRVGDVVSERTVVTGPANETVTVIWEGLGEGDEVLLDGGSTR